MDTAYIKFHCTYTNGRIVSIETCEKCRMSLTCDIYATMLDEEGDCYDIPESKNKCRFNILK